MQFTNAHPVLVVAVLLIFAAGASAQPPSRGPDTNAAGWNEIHQAMRNSGRDMERMPTTGDIDRDFAMLMKMHHQAGIDMAIAHLKHGNDPRIRDMSERMIKEQRREIKELDQLLAAYDKGGRPREGRERRRGQ